MLVRKFQPVVHLDEPLSTAEWVALQKACCPVELLSFPQAGIIHSLRRRGYADIVLGGLQITRKGLERLLDERHRQQKEADPSAG